LLLEALSTYKVKIIVKKLKNWTTPVTVRFQICWAPHLKLKIYTNFVYLVPFKRYYHYNVSRKTEFEATIVYDLFCLHSLLNLLHFSKIGLRMPF
jgi:hypothetical protein